MMTTSSPQDQAGVATGVQGQSRVATPMNLEAERGVLAGGFADPGAVPTLSRQIDPHDFAKPAYGRVWEAMLTISDRGGTLDSVTVAETLRGLGALELVGGPPALQDLAGRTVAPEALGEYAAIVKELSVQRQATAVLQRALAGITAPGASSEAVLGVMEKALAGMRSGKDREPIWLKESLTEALANIEGMMRAAQAQADNPGAPVAAAGVTGVPTGFASLDQLLAGLQAGDLIVVAARPGMGKTAFATQWALAAAQQGHPALIVSLEMSGRQVAQRILSAGAQVPLQQIRTGAIAPVEWTRLGETLQALSGLPVLIEDPGFLTVQQLCRRIRRLHADHGLQVVIVDYLQLLAGGGRRDATRQEDVSEISRALKALAKDLQIPIVALSQLNRSVESRKPPIPQLADLRESGAIEQDADVVLFIYREEYYDKGTDRPGVADVMIKKHRNGPVGDLAFWFNGSLTAFSQGQVAPVSLQAYTQAQVNSGRSHRRGSWGQGAQGGRGHVNDLL